MAIPILNSLPGAPATIYLDFDGHRQPSWGAYTDIVSPAYDLDHDRTTMSEREVEAITEIWGRVAEDYAPFNVNVTTVDPRDFADGRGIHVVIGGHYADWYRVRVGGVSFNNAFTNSMPNVVYVFSEALSHGLPRYVADLISHEVGHTFGLEEQSLYGSQGTRVRDYNSGNSNIWGPLMGNSLAATRSIWHYGTSTSWRTMQDDVAIIARSENGFGFRPDDHADQSDQATSLTVQANGLSAAGVISKLKDHDWFGFESPGGKLHLQVDVAATGPNLDSRLELRDVAGNTVVTSDPDPDLPASLTIELPRGRYFAVVSSHGSYGDLGQYSLSGEINADRGLEVAPASFTKREVAATAQKIQPVVHTSETRQAATAGR